MAWAYPRKFLLDCITWIVYIIFLACHFSFVNFWDEFAIQFVVCTLWEFSRNSFRKLNVHFSVFSQSFSREEYILLWALNSFYLCRWVEEILVCQHFLKVRVSLHGVEQLRVERELHTRVYHISFLCDFLWTIPLNHHKSNLRQIAFIQMLISMATYA